MPSAVNSTKAARTRSERRASAPDGAASARTAAAADAGGEDARALAERLTAPLESAIRLMLLDALSAAADEITRELAPGSVELRLRAGEPDFVVTPAPVDEPDEPARGAQPPEGDEGATARINLRLPEQLKAGVEHAASRERLSVNAL